MVDQIEGGCGLGLYQYGFLFNSKWDKTFSEVFIQLKYTERCKEEILSTQFLSFLYKTDYM